MSTATIKAVVQDWAVYVTGLADKYVIFDDDPNPTAPRPNVETGAFSYCALDILDDEAMGTVFERTSDTATGDNVEQHRYSTRFGTLAVEFYGPDAQDYCRELEMSIGRPDVIRRLEAQGDYTIDTPSTITDAPILRSATREPAASISFSIQWVESETYSTEYAETVDVNTTVTPEGA